MSTDRGRLTLSTTPHRFTPIVCFTPPSSLPHRETFMVICAR